MILNDLVKESDMVQITRNGYSIRIRPNKRMEGEYYCTIRKKNIMRDIDSFSVETVEEVCELIKNFVNQEQECNE